MGQKFEHWQYPPAAYGVVENVKKVLDKMGENRILMAFVLHNLMSMIATTHIPGYPITLPTCECISLRVVRTFRALLE